MLLHPATRISIWLLLAMSVQGLHSIGLVTLSLLLLIFAHPGPGFARILKRTRWLFFSLLLIYGFAAPGEPLLPQIGVASPSLEGLREGALQAWRLLCLFAALAWLLASTPRAALISGLYQIVHPVLGRYAERIVVRIALTLQYAEQTVGAGNWKKTINMATNVPDAPSTVSLRVEPFSWRDGAVLTGMLLALAESRAW
jgi:energy-coupling factor transporter transmembrane protein EcfT